jgi:hypothetical protein
MNNAEVRFQDLHLGKTSAEKESVESPKLLIEGFFDPYGFIKTAREGSEFLFLGHKGSGKSAIGEHLRLSAESQPNFFVRYLSLGDFPYTSFSKIVRGDFEPEAKFPDAWSWLLLLQIIDQFAKDNGCSLQDNEDAQTSLQQLRQAGLLPSSSLKHTVQQTVRKAGGINWRIFQATGEKTAVEGSLVEIPFLVERLKNLVMEIRSESQHIVVVDGLDELLGKRSVQLDSLGSLVYEIDRLNTQFRRSGCPVKIVLLCRTDIYESLPNANKNKIRQDSAVELIWFSDTKTLSESNLVKLANHRASLSAGKPINIFDKYFPATIKNYHGQQETLQFLLDFTRHTPRDFITLLNYIQKQTSSNGVVTESSIQQAVKEYSLSYFVPEINDELTGYLSIEEKRGLLSLFSSLGEREFEFNQLIACSNSIKPPLNIDLQSALSHLFECSAIATLERAGSHTHFTAKYRNRNAVLDVRKKIILHRGMWKALNLK